MIKLFQKNSYKIFSFTIAILFMICLLTFAKIKETPISVHNTVKNQTIVIYSSHPQEMYSYGSKITEVAREIFDKLTKEGINVIYLEVPQYTLRNNAFEVSRSLLQSRVDNYDKAILLDVHIDYPFFQDGLKTTSNETEDSLNIIIGKDNPSFENNKEFATSLLDKINKSNEIKDARIITKESGVFNQDLSSSSILIHVGSGNTSRDDVETYINNLVTALKIIILEN